MANSSRADQGFFAEDVRRKHTGDIGALAPQSQPAGARGDEENRGESRDAHDHPEPQRP